MEIALERAIRLDRYNSAMKRPWNEFVAKSRNGTFLFHRDYMDYHADRFVDHSLMAWRGNQLLAVLPAHRTDDELISHGGLTYGGFVLGARVGAGLMLEIFNRLRDYAGGMGVQRIIYKPVPHIYHERPSEEDLYALFRVGASLVRRDLASALRPGEPLDLAKGRRYTLKRALDAGLELRRSDDFEAFMDMEQKLLDEKYGTKPVHTPAEMRLLATRFPVNVRLFTARRNGEMVAGAIVYESTMVAHAQYIASTEAGREVGALDALFYWLLTDVYRGRPFFDFGISTDREGRELNRGLAENKESYGARSIAYDRYEIRIDGA